MEHPTPWRDGIMEKAGSFEPVVLQPVYKELQRLSDRGGRGRFAAAAVSYVRDSKMKVEAVHGKSADDELVSRALGSGALVATVDDELVSQLKAAGVQVLTLRAGRVELA